MQDTDFCLHFQCCCIWNCHVPQRQVAQSELELMIYTHLLQGTWGQQPEGQPSADQPEIDQKVWKEITDGPGSRSGQLYSLGRQ